MSYADIRRFEALKKLVLAERQAIVERLAAIEEALGRTPIPSSIGGSPEVERRRKIRKSEGGITMREAITLALKAGPLKLKHLVPAVQDMGYVFTTNNPKNSLSAYIYSPSGKRYFARTKQGFVPR